MNLINKIQNLLNFDRIRSFTTWGGENPTIQSRYELMERFKNLVYSCINVRAESIGQYRPKIITKNGQEIEHDFFKLLKQPNETMSRYDLLYNSASYWDLVGEFFWYFPTGEQTKRPKEIILMRPDKIDVAVDEKSGELLGYVYRHSDGTRVPLMPYEVAHLWDFNPFNQWRGLGPVQAGLIYIDAENVSSEFQYHFLNNSASPSGVLTVKGRIGKEAWNKIQNQWREQRTGAENAGKTMFIREADAKFEKIGLSLSDLNMKDLKTLTDERVRKIFRVPNILLGQTDSTGLSRANAETSEYVYAKYVIEPKMRRLDNFIDKLIQRFYNKDLDITHDSIIPADREFQLKEEQAFLDRTISRNEWREKRGLDPVDGGDKRYIGFNEVPIDEDNQQQTKPKETIKLSLEKKENKQQSEARFMKILDKLELKTQKSFQENLKEYLSKQQKAIINMLEVELGEKKEAFENITNPVEEKTTLDKIIEILSLLLFGSFSNSGTYAAQFIGLPASEFVVNQQARDAIFQSTERLMKSFNEETTLKIQKAIAAGVTEGENINQISRRVESIYSDAKGYRAERIAQTESHKAVNFGTAESYKQAGIKRMEWRTDSDPCEYCAAMNGTIVEIGASFIPKGGTIEGKEGGEFINDYEDVKYADLHPNCQCHLVPIKD